MSIQEFVLSENCFTIESFPLPAMRADTICYISIQNVESLEKKMEKIPNIRTLPSMTGVNFM
uniref:Uncharacterized protein n=1 Tax=Rhizophagus irregularis (strain DAOM 181602 / DAOM 197198 / MUCL 43194) TaxID=747089 RepID=U9TSG3_RHIID